MKPFKTPQELRDWAMHIVPEKVYSPSSASDIAVKYISVNDSDTLLYHTQKPNNNGDGGILAYNISISFPREESLIEIEHSIDLTKYIGKVVKIVDNHTQIKYDVLTQGTIDLLKTEFLKSITPLKHEDISSD